MIFKHKYVRSKKLLQLVAGLDCQLCGSHECVQAAHTNWGGGKGRGIKADDNLVAALCMKCHYEIDQGSKWSRDMRQQAWYMAHRNTVENLVNTKQWPVDIPVPDDSQLRFLSLW
jgi:hypothetical protein